jgi:hypothetical protein
LLATALRRGSIMAFTSFLTGLTVDEEQAAIQWLEDAAVSASSESEQTIQAKNVLSIIKGLDSTIKALTQSPAARTAA